MDFFFVFSPTCFFFFCKWFLGDHLKWLTFLNYNYKYIKSMEKVNTCNKIIDLFLELGWKKHILYNNCYCYQVYNYLHLFELISIGILVLFWCDIWFWTVPPWYWQIIWCGLQVFFSTQDISETTQKFRACRFSDLVRRYFFQNWT